MFSFARALAPDSVPAYAAWRLQGRSGTVQLRLRDRSRLWLRPEGARNNDYGVAYEVFVHRYYDLPATVARREARCIVDLGANVGFTCLHWLRSYPAARLIAFEPHPDHAAQCRANLALNAWLDRVELHVAAAGTRRAHIELSDQGTSSHVTRPGEAGIAAEMVDLFEIVGGRRIDILKMDIEGGEYDLLGDPRFATLDIGTLVLEWHARDDVADARQWCVARLTECGFAVQEIFTAADSGMLRAGRIGCRA